MRIVVALAAVLVGAAAAAAGLDTFAQKLFGRPVGAGINYACFARVYDARHLAQHPRQNVTDMTLLARLDGKEPSYYALTLGLHLRKSQALRVTAADCSAQGGLSATAIECNADCEGGPVDIKLKDDGTAWFTFPHNATIWSPNEAGDSVVKPTGLGKDDLLFRLDRAAGALCAPLVADPAEAAALRKQK
jgi:hypothetical protein